MAARACYVLPWPPRGFVLSRGENPRPPARAFGSVEPEALGVRVFDGHGLRSIIATQRRRQIGAVEVMDIRSDEPELRALMIAGLDGDAAAHKALLTRLSAALRAYFKGQFARIGRGPADAEDLVQETLLSLHTRRHTYDRTQLLTPWVFAIARYRLIDYLRRIKVPMSDVPIEEIEGLAANDDTVAVDSGLDLNKLLAQLSPKARQAIKLVKLDGFSVSEASARSGMSPSAVKVSVHRGLQALSRLVRQGGRS